MKLVPRLPLALAREMADSQRGVAWEQLMRNSAVSHPRAFWSSSGNRPSDAELRRLKERIERVMAEGSDRGTLAGNRYFDVMAARILRAELDLSGSEASNAGTWSFIGCVMLPHAIRWRFPGQTGDPTPADRFLGSGRGVRNGLGRLWWRAEVLKDLDAGDPYHLLEELSEDELVAITERPTIAGYRPLALRFALDLAALPIGVDRQAIARDAAKRLRRIRAFVEVRALSPTSVQRLTAEILEESRSALNLMGDLDPSRTSRDVTDDGTAIVLIKRLSANDVGDTGSHQSAIVISDRDASRLARLDETSPNPSVALPVLSSDGDEAWVWRLIHYNGSALGHSTRDEYRLTGTTAFLTASEARAGDRLVVTRDQNGTLRAKVDSA